MNSAIVRDLQRNFRQHHLIAILGAIVLIWAIYQYSTDKNFFPEKFGPSHALSPAATSARATASASSGYQPSSGMQGNEYEDISGIQGPAVSAPSTTKQAVAAPGDDHPNAGGLQELAVDVVIPFADVDHEFWICDCHSHGDLL